MTASSNAVAALAVALAAAAGCAPSRAGYLRVDGWLDDDAATAIRATAQEHAAAQRHDAALQDWRALIRGGRQDYAACWRGARAGAAVALDMDADAEGRDDVAREAVAWSEHAIALQPEAIEGRFAYALALGLLLESSSLESSPGAVLAAARRVIDIDERYEHAGGHRMAGLFYLRAPDLVGGDLDQALEHLHAAVRLAPDHAENRLALAEALIEDEDLEAARAELQRAHLPANAARLQAWLADLRARLDE